MTWLGFNHTDEQTNNISLHKTPLLEPLSVLLPPSQISNKFIYYTDLKLNYI